MWRSAKRPHSRRRRRRNKDDLEPIVPSIFEKNSKLTSRQPRHRQPHRPILKRHQKAQPKPQEPPHRHIRDDACRQPLGMEHGRAAPEQRHVVPRQRRRDDGDVHPARRGRVAEVERGKVEEVDDERELGPDEVAVHPEQDEDEL